MPSNIPAPVFVRTDGDLQQASSFDEAWVRDQLTVGSQGTADARLLVERTANSGDFVRFRRPDAGGYEFGVTRAGFNRATWATLGPGGSRLFTSGWRLDAYPPNASYTSGVALHTEYHGGVGLEFDSALPQARLYGVDLELTGALTLAQDLTVEGNLFVNGTEFIVNTETLEVEDNLILINKGEVGPGVTAGVAGIEVDRGSADNYLFLFDETRDAFAVGLAGDTQVVATREDSPTGGGVAVWDGGNNRFVTTNTDLNTLADLTEATVAAVAATDLIPFYSQLDEGLRVVAVSATTADLLNAADAAAARGVIDAQQQNDGLDYLSGISNLDEPVFIGGRTTLLTPSGWQTFNYQTASLTTDHVWLGASSPGAPPVEFETGETGRDLLSAANAATARSTLDLGTMALEAAADYGKLGDSNTWTNANSFDRGDNGSMTITTPDSVIGLLARDGSTNNRSDVRFYNGRIALVTHQATGSPAGNSGINIFAGGTAIGATSLVGSERLRVAGTIRGATAKPTFTDLDSVIDFLDLIFS